MSRRISLEPLTKEAFSPFGDVIDAVGEPTYFINKGRCGRFHDLARPQLSGDDDVALSVGVSDPVSLPMALDLMERHPLGSQAFIPMEGTQMVVTVAEDDNGKPGTPRAFLSDGRQGIQYDRNCWHGVLSPLTGPARFLIVDRIGTGRNLEEVTLDTPYMIAMAE